MIKLPQNINLFSFVNYFCCWNIVAFFGFFGMILIWTSVTQEISMLDFTPIPLKCY
jgi:hypothetical protein